MYAYSVCAVRLPLVEVRTRLAGGRARRALALVTTSNYYYHYY